MAGIFYSKITVRLTVDYVRLLMEIKNSITVCSFLFLQTGSVFVYIMILFNICFYEASLQARYLSVYLHTKPAITYDKRC